MLRPDDVETILTTHDLSVFLEDMVKDDRDLKIDVDYESGVIHELSGILRWSLRENRSIRRLGDQ